MCIEQIFDLVSSDRMIDIDGDFFLNTCDKNILLIDYISAEMITSIHEEDDYYFQKVMDNELPLNVFVEVENRYKRLCNHFSKLSRTYCCLTYHVPLEMSSPAKFCASEISVLISNNISPMEIFLVENREILDSISLVGTREIGISELYFTDIRLIIEFNGLCCLIWTDNPSTLEQIKAEVKSSGLFANRYYGGLQAER
jgi:hypothetical protein